MRPDDPRSPRLGSEPAEPTAGEVWLGLAAAIALYLCGAAFFALVCLRLMGVV